MIRIFSVRFHSAAENNLEWFELIYDSKRKSTEKNGFWQFNLSVNDKWTDDSPLAMPRVYVMMHKFHVLLAHSINDLLHNTRVTVRKHRG